MRKINGSRCEAPFKVTSHPHLHSKSIILRPTEHDTPEEPSLKKSFLHPFSYKMNRFLKIQCAAKKKRGPGRKYSKYQKQQILKRRRSLRHPTVNENIIGNDVLLKSHEHRPFYPDPEQNTAIRLVKAAFTRRFSSSFVRSIGNAAINRPPLRFRACFSRAAGVVQCSSARVCQPDFAARRSYFLESLHVGHLLLPAA